MRFVLCCAVLLTAFSGLLPATPAHDGAVLKSEFIFETAPFPACHASTIVETTPGHLVAAWFGGTAERNPDVGIWVARQENGKWMPPVEVANGVQADGSRVSAWNPVLFQPREGPLLLFYKLGPEPRRWWGMVTTSGDGGKTWAPARRLPDGILGPIKNKPVQLADGSLLAPSSTESEEAGWQVHFERSTDLGRTWTATPPVNTKAEFNAIQPSLLFFPDGRLEAVGRSKNGVVYQTWSADDGRTWSKLTPTNLPNPSSGTDAVTLADGRQLIVYNHTPTGRTPLNVAVSRDGSNWQPVLVLEDGPGEYSYPAVIQTSDGLVHITYTWQRRRIKHVVLDPRKL